MKLRNTRHRLRRTAEFTLVRKYGKCINNKAFALQALKVPTQEGELSPARLGIIVSRKVGNAVYRNRAKRVFREIFRCNQYLINDNVDIVIVVRKIFNKYNYHQLEDIFLDLCSKAGIKN
jgi:ribonuclease P protein component